MGEPCAKTAENANGRQAREILEGLEVEGASPAYRANQPGDPPKRLRAPCTIHYPSPDGQGVFESRGRVREVSRTGLSLLGRQALAANTDVHLTVNLPDGRAFNLTGTVVFSREIRPQCHLIVVRLRPVDDKRLTECRSDKIQTAATTEKEGSADERAETDQDESDSAFGARERSLRMLANAARYGITSKETISNIIRLTLSPDFAIRRATLAALFEARGPEATAALVNLLHDPSVQIQAEAVEILGRLEAASAVEPLKELLTHDDDVVALRTAEALGRLKDDSGLAAAIRHLRSDHRHTRLAAQVLGVIVGQTFRSTPSGVTQARKYRKKARL